MKKNYLFVFILITAIIPSTCLATTYSWNDVTGITGNSYRLDFTGSTVTIDAYTTNGGPTAANWYIDWIQFKITSTQITLGGPLTGPVSGWDFTNSSAPVNLQKFGGGIPNDGFNLIYYTGIKVPNASLDSGVPLDGNDYQWVLDDVDLGVQTLLPTEGPLGATLKVGYYSLKPNGKFETRQMSQTVPEPGTLFLLGSGLLGLAGFGFAKRRRERK